jgi:O-antigen ligase
MAASLSRSSSRTPALVQAMAVIGFPFIAAMTVAGTYFNKEVIVTAAWVAFGTIGILFVRPAIGIMVMTAAYMLAAYPTILQSLGVFTINNLLGVAFVLLLAMRILETRDLEFLRVPAVRVFMVMWVLFFISEYHSHGEFPLIQASWGKVHALDRSDTMWHEFQTRLAFMIFIIMFVRDKPDIKLVHAAFFLGLFAAVPSAVWNLATGNLNRGFRIMSSVTGGTNPNRLAMICLMEIGCWWCWLHAKPTQLRWGLTLTAILMSVVTLLGTGSRSGFLGLLFLGFVLQTSGAAYRLRPGQIGAMAFAGLIILLTIIPRAAVERMVNFSPDRGEIGASSNKLREDTVWTAVEIAQDHPILGIGLGNFREVSRQVYRNKFFRPPHNSFLWALTEGGIAVLLAYLALFAFLWRDLQYIRRVAHLDEDLAHVATAIRTVFLLLMFFSAFADLWLAPQTYVLAGLIYCIRRYYENVAREATRVAVPVGPARVGAPVLALG